VISLPTSSFCRATPRRTSAICSTSRTSCSEQISSLGSKLHWTTCSGRPLKIKSCSGHICSLWNKLRWTNMFS
jgi:hypothetical protein